MNKLTPRERILSVVVGGAVFVFLNLYLIQTLVQTRATLLAGAESRAHQLRTMEFLLAEKDFWQTRQTWLEAHQPKLTDPDTAGGQLLDDIRKAAKSANVTLDNAQPRAPSYLQKYTSVSVELDTKSSFKAIILFLVQLHDPEKFNAIESTSLKKDPTDPTQMRGHFRIARWYAPRPDLAGGNRSAQR